ncbi:MAG: aminotransferase class III-fold pyridoxal phosphate-dependent enzyme [Candidatus Marinimicrobia bacterium]|nr:aminotransferase class III-fold pyridoxal phosphate-dependent enzyme [Candidatus Neomarinimicrobiota bacterium]MBL7009657.1 aminotransferase class III-fold pyridoxal phosphate-dependent enzyme [Candidatus Neomarinimicrobiota bacterium]MBL7029600.1 aminotransferase class III-fold pyridoxal phosphate-dependent enzyme [Candidatus Neomarinimicrobiota bacterium]
MLDKNSIRSLREKYLSPSLSLSYEEPLHIVRGEGQYLFDADGKQYLDAVNNIQHVGHCHPRVVEAAQRQYERLNTNTRYLDEVVVHYAKALTDKLPLGLDVCFFTNSGSEANDLALRIARKYTQSKETIVLDGAYHGNLSSLIEISPYKHKGPGGVGAPDFVYTIPMPDCYRGKYRGEKSTRRYVKEVVEAIEKIHEKNKKVSTFISEALMGCGGQLVLPNNFLKEAFELIRNVGGLCISDEVQIGFGRMGNHFWGFQTEDVIPDIVTMGKSMGNGHPLSAVVTTKEIADNFNNGMEYFNSFGGNPVSCAVGQAVLDIIEEENLQQNAMDVGNYLINRLKELQSKYEIIGDVRGHGLFIGIELIKDSASFIPASEEANMVVNQMKDVGILISLDGPDHNVLKIKPPIIFTRENADTLVFNLTSIFSQLF